VVPRASLDAGLKSNNPSLPQSQMETSHLAYSLVTVLTKLP